jgi:hypothetical protein
MSEQQVSIKYFPIVAGHKNNIHYGSYGSLYKLMENSDNEYKVYEYLKNNHTVFYDKFIPKLLKRKNNMIQLEDLTAQYTIPLTMDIKVGSRKNGKKHTHTYFSVKGYTDSVQLNSKIIMTDDDVIKHMNSFLSKCPDKHNVICSWIDKLTLINIQIKNININFAGSSIIFLYDASSDKHNADLIDFGRSVLSDTYDNNIIIAIKKLIELLKLLI